LLHAGNCIGCRKQAGILSFFFQSRESFKKQSPPGQIGVPTPQNIGGAAIQLFHRAYHKHIHHLPTGSIRKGQALGL